MMDVTPNDVIDLESLTFEQLVQERASVKAEIAEITAQLRDASRRPASPEDDSGEWEDYRAWRRRARWALVYRGKEFEAIKALLVQRLEERRQLNAEQRAQNLARHVAEQPKALKTPEQWAAHHAQIAAQKATLLEDLRDEGGADALLLRVKRVLSHLLPAGVGHVAMVERLDETDQQTLADLSVYLLNRYGRANVKAYIRDEMEPAS